MDAQRRPLGCVVLVGSVAARESVGDGVEAPRSILHGEIKAEQLVDPLMLRHGREPLIQQVLEAVVVRVNLKRVPPKVGTPTGPVVRAPFRASNAALASSSQAKVSWRRSCVGGVAMMLKSRMNFR